MPGQRKKPSPGATNVSEFLFLFYFGVYFMFCEHFPGKLANITKKKKQFLKKKHFYLPDLLRVRLLGSNQNGKPDFRIERVLASGHPTNHPANHPTAAAHSGELWLPATIKTVFVTLKNPDKEGRRGGALGGDIIH